MTHLAIRRMSHFSVPWIQSNLYQNTLLSVQILMMIQSLVRIQVMMQLGWSLRPYYRLED